MEVITMKETGTMTWRQWLELHRQIEAENERKLREWKEGQRNVQDTVKSAG